VSTIENPRPDPGAVLELGGREWPLVTLDYLTVPELRYVKATFGLALGDVAAGLQTMDVDCIYAWFIVSMRRVDDAITVEVIDRMIGDTPLATVMADYVKKAAPEVAELAAPDPSSSPAPTESSGNGVGNGGSSSSDTTLPSSPSALFGVPSTPTPPSSG
jgi:hypothetical protein